MKGKRPFDFWIFISVLMLLSIGLIMLFSASYPSAYSYHKGNAYYFVERQILFAIVGVIGMLIISRIDYHKLGKISPILFVASLVLLVLVRIPGIGTKLNGAYRWIFIGPLSFQPSELLKISMILFFSYSLSKRKDDLKYFFKGLFPYLILIGLFSGLLLIEPHLSCTVLVVIVATIILFCAGAKIKHFVLLGMPAIGAFIVAITTMEHARKRLTTFLHPMEDKQGDSWQIIQSLYAIGSGKLFGKGLGKGMQKHLYLPEPYNDFIFAVIAEELGFIGVVAILMLFFVFIWRGIKVAINTPDVFGSLVAIGLTSLIGMQVVINVAVVTSSIPATGIALPFFSSGGTSLTFMLCSIGILLNISKQANYERI
ncbi:putative lipid II flippase FtsW [Pseudobacteroides cellulosolvens]|uniref:Probable peptidoglycan glycosyltransferase FtsW n=1 Tax=Pseudobacteroides cellulosolvens ATCC 35603 = DSM 2933 TaxID=398512 RepID=A0A0L6JGU5_9FIRM|nr:putative lipid II flippase FtsW [Pseudobacteroides cellulosolvens]KNY24943.1 cell division protein FtsW [Pseudobacteroides cellulosolvens ATCC 35603 = DSM 2933]